MRKALFLALILIAIPLTAAIDVELLSTNPAPLQAGEYADLTFRIIVEETDQDLNDITLSVEETPYISAASNPRTYSRILSGDQVTATLRVYVEDNTPQGYTNVISNLEFERATLQVEHEIFVEEEESDAMLRVGSVQTTPNTLLPDTQDNELTLTLQNLGDKEAELITAELIINDDLANPSYAFSTTDSIASLASGESAELTFTVDVEEEARSAIAAIIDLRYRTQSEISGSYNTFTESINFNLPIDDAPFLQITAQMPQGEFSAGTTDNTLRFNITNNGEEEASDVRVRIFPDISYPFIFERTSQYIGAKIQPGQTVTGQVSFEVLSSAQVREYPISINLESLVGTSRYTQEDTISINVESEQSRAASNAPQLIIGAIAIAAIILGILVYRRRKKSEKK